MRLLQLSGEIFLVCLGFHTLVWNHDHFMLYALGFFILELLILNWNTTGYKYYIYIENQTTNKPIVFYFERLAFPHALCVCSLCTCLKKQRSFVGCSLYWLKTVKDCLLTFVPWREWRCVRMGIKLLKWSALEQQGYSGVRRQWLRVSCRGGTPQLASFAGTPARLRGTSVTDS